MEGKAGAKLLFAETIHCHPPGAPLGLRGYSKEPQTCPAALTEFCGSDFVSEDLPRQAHREIISETPKFSPFINIFRN